MRVSASRLWACFVCTLFVSVHACVSVARLCACCSVFACMHAILQVGAVMFFFYSDGSQTLAMWNERASAQNSSKTKGKIVCVLAARELKPHHQCRGKTGVATFRARWNWAMSASKPILLLFRLSMRYVLKTPSPSAPDCPRNLRASGIEGSTHAQRKHNIWGARQRRASARRRCAPTRRGPLT